MLFNKAPHKSISLRNAKKVSTMDNYPKQIIIALEKQFLKYSNIIKAFMQI